MEHARPDQPTLSSLPPIATHHATRWPWKSLLIGAALAALAWLVDARVAAYATDDEVRHRILPVFNMLASMVFFLTPIAILASFPNARRLCIGFALPLLLSTVITHLVKWAVGRARPYMGFGAFHFNPFRHISDVEAFAWRGEYASFPSGHATAAATLAVLFGIYCPRARWAFYFFAIMVGLERIINNRHFLSDVLAGFIVGTVSVYICLRALGWDYYRKELPRGPATMP
jgi:membrane-associated phospholipid phosphatase